MIGSHLQCMALATVTARMWQARCTRSACQRTHLGQVVSAGALLVQLPPQLPHLCPSNSTKSVRDEAWQKLFKQLLRQTLQIPVDFLYNLAAAAERVISNALYPYTKTINRPLASRSLAASPTRASASSATRVVALSAICDVTPSRAALSATFASSSIMRAACTWRRASAVSANRMGSHSASAAHL